MIRTSPGVARDEGAYIYRNGIRIPEGGVDINMAIGYLFSGNLQVACILLLRSQCWHVLVCTCIACRGGLDPCFANPDPYSLLFQCLFWHVHKTVGLQIRTRSNVRNAICT